MMIREEFKDWGVRNVSDKDWTLSQLDSLSFAYFLTDFFPKTPLKSQKQLQEFILNGNDELWDDQNLLYDFLFSQHLPHAKWKPKTLKNIMSDEDFPAVKDYLEKLKQRSDFLHHCEIFKRHALYDTPYLQNLHRKLTPLVEGALKRKLQSTYAFLSMYGSEGICPPHRDRQRCQWTLDVCLNQDQPWALHVETESYLLNENEGLIYSGTDQLHWRDRIHPGGHCDLVFFHFEEA